MVDQILSKSMNCAEAGEPNIVSGTGDDIITAILNCTAIPHTKEQSGAHMYATNNIAYTRQKLASRFGFTLIELLTTTAIIGVLTSIAAPMYRDYLVQAKVSEGVLILGELRRRVSIGFNQYGALGSTIPGSPTADGQVYGGPFYSYPTLFGKTSDIWDQIEYQPKGPHRVIVLRAQRKSEWNNSDIGLHLQVKLNTDNTLAFRCTINDNITRMQYVPVSCRDGDVDDWVSW